VVNALVSKYDEPGMSTFIGNLLRLYTKSNKLIEAFMNMEILNKLSKLISNPDFNIQSDSYETFKVLIMLISSL
jgi:Mo25-like